VAYRLGEVVEVDGCEAEEVVAAEPADRRHASLPPRLPLGAVRRRRRSGVSSPGRVGLGGWRRSIRIRVLLPPLSSQSGS
jgi:hypothetical protein